jgi:hypothetical protein
LNKNKENVFLSKPMLSRQDKSYFLKTSTVDTTMNPWWQAGRVASQTKEKLGDVEKLGDKYGLFGISPCSSSVELVFIF